MRPISRLFGFSLIELMIVIAIIGILSVIAIPSYQTYTKRARFSEVIGASDIFKTAVSLAIQQGTPLTEIANGQNGIPLEATPTKHLATIKVENGIITATGTDLVNQATYILQPNIDGSEWEIAGSCIEKALCNAK